MTFSDVDKAATGTGEGAKADEAYQILETCYKGGVNFFDCADESDGPLPEGLPPGSRWCLTDAHDPTSVKRCIDCAGPGGLECPPLPEPAHGKFVCDHTAPAYKSRCERKGDT